MEVKLTHLRNPFSFFCFQEDVAHVHLDVVPENNSGLIRNKFDLSGVSHGQYVAVLWNDNWVRGIVTLETQFLIWLIDYGTYLRPNEKTVYINLPAEDKKYPTKVFEASIHGVTPTQKVLNEMCEIADDVSINWSNGAIEKAQQLLAQAAKVYFVPIALMSTKNNDVVIGDLYFRIKGKIVNLVEQLEEWPGFLKKDEETYIENLSKFYISRRQHRASLKKPLPQINLPTITVDTTLDEYRTICAFAPECELSDYDDDEEENDSNSDEGSTITYLDSASPSKSAFQLTPSEIERYANVNITVSGREYNVLNVLLNKARDLYMCEKYKNAKSVGRATSRSSQFRNVLED